MGIRLPFVPDFCYNPKDDQFQESPIHHLLRIPQRRPQGRLAFHPFYKKRTAKMGGALLTVAYSSGSKMDSTKEASTL